MRKFLALGTALTLVLGFVGSAQGITSSALPPAPAGSVNVFIDELVDGNWDSRREATNFQTGESWACPNLPYTSGPCNFKESKLRFYGSNLLPVCATNAQQDCIESLSFESAPGNSITGENIGYAGGAKYPAISKLGIQEGSQISLWNLPGINHSGSESTYSVTIRSRQTFDLETNKFTTISLDASVAPYSLKLGNYSAPENKICPSSTDNKLCGGNVPDECVWTDNGKCGLRTEFAGNPKITLKIRISNEIGGWFRGRLTETSIGVEKFNSKNNQITISGKPVSVARFAAQVKKVDVSDKAMKALETPWIPLKDLFLGNRSVGAFSTEGWNNVPYIYLDEFRDEAKDTSIAATSLWNFETATAGTSNRCLADTSRVLGIVTTNATAYDGTAPLFKSGYLTYKVGGMHYLPGGEDLSLGTYDLAVRSDVARCLYGFSKAPLSATVSVVNEKGTKSVATTVVKETKDGWLKMSAYGFTFSKKTIKVKITKKKKK